MWEILFVMFIAFAGLPAHSASAQSQQGDGSSSSVSINVSARVISSIDLITLRNIRFQEVQPGQKQITINPVNDANAGKMKASGRAEAPIKVSYFKQWQLTRTDGPGKLTFFYQVSGSTEDDQSTSELLKNDNRDLHFNNDGDFYFWIGGHVDITEAQPGNYEGDFTIEIEYI